MDYGSVPPEVNSARIYSGPGPASMLAAGAAWDALASDLRSSAAGYGTAVAGLEAVWEGPSSTAMFAAATPYAAWLRATAARAETAAGQARSAVEAYETAFAATVPPAAIAMNRVDLAALTATNILGEHTTAIASNEARYAAMWAQDAAAMYGYAADSAGATTLSPFESPPPVAAAQQAATNAHAVASASATAQAELSRLTSALPGTLRSLATPAAGAPSSLTGLLSSLDSSPLASAAAEVELIPKATLPLNDIAISAIMGIVLGVGNTTSAIKAITTPALGAGLGSAATAPAVSAGLGQAGFVGALAVPPSWAAATPAIRAAAAVLSDTSGRAVAATALAEGSFVSAVSASAVTGMVVPGLLNRRESRLRNTPHRTTTALRDPAPPTDLERVVAGMVHDPDSVQHWYTNGADLDNLLAELRRKPGTHAVHVANDSRKTMPPNT